MSATPRHAGRHRAPRKRRLGPLPGAVPAAAVATVAVVGVGVAVSGSASVTSAEQAPASLAAGSAASTAAPATSSSAARTVSAQEAATATVDKRKRTLSRSLGRRTTASATSETKPRWTTATLNLWSSPAESAEKVGEIGEAIKVRATGRTDNERAEIMVDGTPRWVSADYLANEKPDPVVSMAPCPDTSIERGLKASTIKVYRSVCAAFPEVTEYGGYAGRVEHNTGNAIDVMVYGNKALGDRIAAWVHKNAAEFDLYDIIWYQRIWTPVRASEGWRGMANRGSATANHIDHVHIGTN